MAPDPFRFVSRDISDALDHLSDFTAGPKLSDYNSVRQAKVPVSEVLAYDDYSAWGEWEPGELAELDEAELRDALTGFRGSAWADRVLKWQEEGIPAVVVFPAEGVIGDGRGRLSFAVGMGIPEVPVVWLRPKNLASRLKF